jgi:hypothetical protein
MIIDPSQGLISVLEFNGEKAEGSLDWGMVISILYLSL